MAIEGLAATAGATMARRLADKYVALVVHNFAQTGCLWEKYEVVKGGLEVGGEYKMPRPCRLVRWRVHLLWRRGGIA